MKRIKRFKNIFPYLQGNFLVYRLPGHLGLKPSESWWWIPLQFSQSRLCWSSLAVLAAYFTFFVVSWILAFIFVLRFLLATGPRFTKRLSFLASSTCYFRYTCTHFQPRKTGLDTRFLVQGWNYSQYRFANSLGGTYVCSWLLEKSGPSHTLC